jgi:membrane-associated PAP2 superfamily phosphatase
MYTRKRLLIAVISLIFAWLLFQITDIDTIVQDLFFNKQTKSWLIDKHDSDLKLAFYQTPKRIIAVIGILCLIFLGYLYTPQGKKKHPSKALRNSLLLFVASLMFVPLIVAGSKQFTNNYCPDQGEHYNGSYPYVKLLESYPDNFSPPKKGKCFPAGHATGGFALLCLYFIFNKKYKKLALISALAIGWTMGVYQMMKGAHYLSDTISSMILSYIVILVLNSLIIRKNKKSS